METNRRPPFRYLVSLALLAATAARADGPVVLKLGTLAPSGSAWHELLKEMGQRWASASAGAVTLRIYAGGAQGSEGDMIRKMGVGQLQAAALSNVGMHDITPEPKGLSIPLFFAGEDEAECAFDAVRPALEEALAHRGYTVVHWSRLGALYLYCTEPRRTPADMATARFFAQEGDPRAADGWRAAGFRVVQLSATDLYPALQTGMVDCVPSLPIYVLTARLFEKARYMSDLPWGYMYGATVVRRDAWERIPAEARATLGAIARETGRKADTEVRRMNADALAAMARQGLSTVAVDPAPWRAAIEKGYPFLRDGVVPAPFFDAVAAAREACRSRAPR
jgi:TRAP-type C4-dicarboxylate transport system substrate-binding protein